MNKFLIKIGVISLVLLGSAGSFGMTKELLVARLDHKPLLLENAPFNFVGLPVEMQRKVLMDSDGSSFYTISKTSTKMHKEMSLCEKEYSANMLQKKGIALEHMHKDWEQFRVYKKLFKGSSLTAKSEYVKFDDMYQMSKAKLALANTYFICGAHCDAIRISQKVCAIYYNLPWNDDLRRLEIELERIFG